MKDWQLGDVAELVLPDDRRPGFLAPAVRIVELRPNTFGRTDCRVVPVAGSGERWVRSASLSAARHEKVTL